MRIQTIIAVLSLCILGSGAFAGGKMDFTGIWVFNESKSALDEFGTQFLPAQMTVTQSDTDIVAKKLFISDYGDDMEFEDQMIADGKPHESVVMESPRTITATWSGNKDTLHVAVVMMFQGGTSEIKLDEDWTLKDGILVIQHASSSEWGERKLTMVFDKKEE
ncbi:hypothetical protein JW948_13920 [bacterium]|nr:hypothetical protein [bacterium]